MFAGQSQLKPWLEEHGYIKASTETTRQTEKAKRYGELVKKNGIFPTTHSGSSVVKTLSTQQQQQYKKRQQQRLLKKTNATQPSKEDCLEYNMSLDHCISIPPSTTTHNCLSGGVLDIPPAEKHTFFNLYAKDVAVDMMHYFAAAAPNLPGVQPHAQHSLSENGDARAFKPMLDVDLKFWQAPTANDQFYIGVLAQVIASAVRNKFSYISNKDWRKKGICVVSQTLARPIGEPVAYKRLGDDERRRVKKERTNAATGMDFNLNDMDENAQDGFGDEREVVQVIISSSENDEDDDNNDNGPPLRTSMSTITPLSFSMSLDPNASLSNQIHPHLLSSSTASLATSSSTIENNQRYQNTSGSTIYAPSSDAVCVSPNTPMTNGVKPERNATIHPHKMGVHFNFPFLPAVNTDEAELIAEHCAQMVVANFASKRVIHDRISMVMLEAVLNDANDEEDDEEKEDDDDATTQITIPTFGDFTYDKLIHYWNGKVIDHKIYEGEPHLRKLYSHKIVRCNACKQRKSGSSQQKKQFTNADNDNATIGFVAECPMCKGTKKASEGPAAIYDVTYVFDGDLNMAMPEQLKPLLETDNMTYFPSAYSPTCSGNDVQVRYTKKAYDYHNDLLRLNPIKVPIITASNEDSNTTTPVFGSSLKKSWRYITTSLPPIRRFPQFASFEQHCTYITLMVQLTSIRLYQSTVGISDDLWHTLRTPGFCAIDLKIFGDAGSPMLIHDNHAKLSYHVFKKETEPRLREFAKLSATMCLINVKCELAVSELIQNAHPNWSDLLLIGYKLMKSNKPIELNSRLRYKYSALDIDALEYKGQAFIVEANGVGCHFCTCRTAAKVTKVTGEVVEKGLTHSQSKVFFRVIPGAIIQLCHSESIKHAINDPVCLNSHGVIIHFSLELARSLFPDAKGPAKSFMDKISHRNGLNALRIIV
jgi:hypothetical protein